MLADFSTEVGALAMPGDAANVITVGAAGWDGKAQPYSAAGPPAFVELAKKPTLFAYDQVLTEKGPAFGTSVANAYAAGVAAVLSGAGNSHEELLKHDRIPKWPGAAAYEEKSKLCRRFLIEAIC